MLKRALLLLILALLLSVQAPAKAGMADTRQLYLPAIQRGSQILYTNPVTYEIDKFLAVESINYEIDDLRVYLPGMITWDSQRVNSQEFYPTPDAVTIEPEHGNQILFWQASSPDPGQRTDFGQHVNITVYAIESKIAAAEVPPYDTSSDLYQRYTRSETNLEAGDDLIHQAMQEAVGAETNPYLQARLIYEYTAQRLHYEYNSGLQGAVRTLELGSGECGDYASVFVALARAAGIPARPVVGYHAYSGETYHVWAEFYVQDLGWVPADPQIGDLGDTANAWYFGNLPNTRVILSKNFNIALLPSTNTASLFQTYYWWVRGSGSGLKVSDGWEVIRP